MIPEGVTEIGNEVFSECKNLTGITFPSTLVRIGERAFLNCSSLSSIALPDGLISIGTAAFSGCNCLTGTITLPGNIVNLETDVFRDCRGLSGVVIPDGVKSIGERAFGSCTGIKSMELPDGVMNIERWAFENCSSMTSIKLPENLTKISEGILIGCTGLKEIQLPKNITSIENNAFDNCTGLVTIEVPDSVTYIGGRVFIGTQLTAVAIPDSVLNVDDTVFSMESPYSWPEIYYDGKIYCHKNSYIAQYAQEKNLNVVFVDGDLGEAMRNDLTNKENNADSDNAQEENKNSDEPGDSAVEFTGLTIPDQLTIYTGEQKFIDVVCEPETASEETVTWKSSNPEVAMVDNDGRVYGLKSGTVQIVATTPNNITAVCTLKVEKPQLTIKKAKLKLKVGKKARIKAVCQPDTEMTYSSKNKQIAAVTAAGLIKAKKKGKTVIVVKANGISKKVKVTVVK